MNAPLPPNPVTIDVRVGQYVQLRDMIKKEDDAHKEAMAPKRELLEKLNGVLLQELNRVGADSVNTAAGTVYRTAKRSASIADMPAFWTYCITQGNFDLIDKKANVTACVEYAEKNNAPPPGVNLNTTYLVGVRRK